MEHDKIINLLKRASEQSSTFQTKKWIEVSDNANGSCNANSQIKLTNALPKLRLCDYSDTYIFVSKVILIAEAVPTNATQKRDRRNKKATFKNCALFIDCLRKIANRQVNIDKNRSDTNA